MISKILWVCFLNHPTLAGDGVYGTGYKGSMNATKKGTSTPTPGANTRLPFQSNEQKFLLDYTECKNITIKTGFNKENDNIKLFNEGTHSDWQAIIPKTDMALFTPKIKFSMI